MVIVGEFGKGNVLGPGSRVKATEDPKISFYFLVNAFSFPISLRVIGGGEDKFVTKEFPQFFSKSGGELWSSIRDDLIIETKSFENFGEEQGGDSGGVNGFLGRAENYPLSKPMVDHNQKGIKTIRKGKVSDQIIGDLLEGAGAGGQDGEKWRSRWMGIDLVLLARGTAVDKTVNIRGEARPPKLRGNKLVSFENSRMTSSEMVMVTSNDRVVQVSISRDIDTALVSQDASIIVPVGEA